MSLVEKFEGWKKKVADRKERKKKDKLARGKSIHDYVVAKQKGNARSAPSTEAYRDGWDRIFGRKDEKDEPR